MLTQRTNLLLTPEDHQLLVYLATKYRTTKGELIRRAIKKTYAPQARLAQASSLHPLDAISKIVKKYHVQGLTLSEIKAFTAYGRH